MSALPGHPKQGSLPLGGSGVGSFAKHCFAYSAKGAPMSTNVSEEQRASAAANHPADARQDEGAIVTHVRRSAR